MKKESIALILFSTLAFANADAGITLPDIVGDNMVVQQNADARLWGWASPGSEITVSGSWDNGSQIKTKTDKDGRWQVALPTPDATFTPQTISVKGDGDNIVINNVAVGEVWFCSGQSNMEMPLRGFWTQPVEGAAEAIAYSGRYPGIRFAKVPKTAAYTPQERVASPWKVSCPENAYDFSALAYFFAESLTKLLDVPVGIIDCSYGGSKLEGWQSREQLDKYPEWNVEKEMNDSALAEYERINVMYNAMLNPLIGYTIRGFLWNQGESNVGRHSTYPTHQRDMVNEWRTKWNLGELPFYFVEIPGWNYDNPEGNNAAFFRECQHKAAEITPSSEIVCTADLVYPFEVDDIHARKKKEIGERLAFMAAGKTYGIKGMPTEYPRYKSMEINGDKAILSFENAWEGFTPNKELEGFEVAGSDRIFRPAIARENPQTLRIEVERPAGVDEIKSVRYNFKNFAIGKVFNVLGLPLVPFRTDDWPE